MGASHVLSQHWKATLMANRLTILEPRSLKDRAKYQAFKQAFGFFPDVMRTMFSSTRLELGGPYQAVMMAYHRPSASWSKGEIELFASFVSSQNHCNF